MSVFLNEEFYPIRQCGWPGQRAGVFEHNHQLRGAVFGGYRVHPSRGLWNLSLWSQEKYREEREGEQFTIKPFISQGKPLKVAY